MEDFARKRDNIAFLLHTRGSIFKVRCKGERTLARRAPLNRASQNNQKQRKNNFFLLITVILCLILFFAKKVTKNFFFHPLDEIDFIFSKNENSIHNFITLMIHIFCCFFLPFCKESHVLMAKKSTAQKIITTTKITIITAQSRRKQKT